MPDEFKGAVCRGSYALGTACGHCERCKAEAIKRMGETGDPVMFASSDRNGDATGLVRSVVGEISRMEYEGDILGIACVIVDKDGDLRTLFAYQPNSKLPLVAGTAVLQKNVIDGAMMQIVKPRE